jgi:hypothetical protein
MIRRYLLIAAAMLAVDWVVGALAAAHVVPLWSFLLLNFPFGLPFVWLETHWAGTRYSLGEGQSISEAWSFVALFFSAFAQAWLYSLLLGFWRKRQATRAS